MRTLLPLALAIIVAANPIAYSNALNVSATVLNTPLPSQLILLKETLCGNSTVYVYGYEGKPYLILLVGLEKETTNCTLPCRACAEPHTAIMEARSPVAQTMIERYGLTARTTLPANDTTTVTATGEVAAKPGNTILNRLATGAATVTIAAIAATAVWLAWRKRM